MSEFHSEVSRTLQAMGVAHALEHLTEDGFFSSKDFFNIYLTCRLTIVLVITKHGFCVDLTKLDKDT